jgi:hypothetical protein
MRRIPAAAVVILAACALWITGARAEGLPIPPVPPDHPPLADIAPIPDEDARAPIPPASASASVDVKFFQTRRYNPALGFAPGSAYRANEDRRPIQPPGFNISVPLK